MDTEVLSKLDTKMTELWIKNARKESSLKILIITLIELLQKSG